MVVRYDVPDVLFDGPIFEDAACGASFMRFDEQPGVHFEPDASIVWLTNPPSSGDHFGEWARWGIHTTVIPRGYWVHSLEHGAVVLLYNCAKLPAGTDCEPFKQALRDASAAIPSDGTCAAPVRVRTVITPDPLIDTAIAAVAWGAVYHSPCVDLPSLSEFAKANYAKGPEDLCAAGVTTF